MLFFAQNVACFCRHNLSELVFYRALFQARVVPAWRFKIGIKNQRNQPVARSLLLLEILLLSLDIKN